MNISAYEPEIGEEQKEGLREMLRGLASGDSVKFDNGAAVFAWTWERAKEIYIWVNNHPLLVVFATSWEIGGSHFFISNFENRDRFGSRANQIGACLLVLSAKLGLAEDEEMMNWVAGIIGTSRENETVVVNTAERVEVAEERIAIGPAGELATWIDEQWWLANGEPAEVEGWTVCEV